MKIFVTGDKGMIGSQLVMGLLDAGYQVIGVDRSGKQEKRKDYTHYCAEIGEKDRIKSIIIDEKVDRIIHLAALAHTEGVEDTSWQRYKYVNVECAKNIFDAAGGRPVLFISTTDVYGFYDGKNPVNGKSKIKPASKYGKSKALAERECERLKNYDIFRLSPVYSNEIKRDIQKRYYLKYPGIAYIIGRGLEYEVLNIKKAVSAMVSWCGKDPQNGISIIKDEKMLRTDDCIRDEHKAGKAKIVIHVPKIVVTLGYKALYQLSGENEKTYLLNKAAYPLRSEMFNMDTKKRILQIISYMYPAISGNGQTAYDISNCLPKDEYEQMIICFNTTGFVDVHDTRCTGTVYGKLNGIPVTRCGVITNVASQLLSPSYPFELKKALRGFKPNIVILHCPNPFLAEFILPYLKDKEFKLVLYWHCDIVKQKIIGKVFYRQNMKLLHYADRVVATSPNYIKGSQYLRKFKEKCTVIPSCIREDQNEIMSESKELAERIRSKNQGKIICFALGRHVPYKGFEYLIESSKYLDEKYVIFIGSEGPLTEKLKSLASKDHKIHFTGRLSPTELQAYYLACDIFCFPSITKNEAYGLALCDALYYGKPAVTFTISGSGVNYVSLNGVTGIEVPNRDVKEYAQAIKTLGNDKELRHTYGEEGKKRAINLFLYNRFKKNINLMISSLER